MFANFIYFIVAILIFATYQPSDEVQLGWTEALSLFLMKTFLFSLLSRYRFHRILQRSVSGNLFDFEPLFQSTLSRLSIIAVAVYALDIYGLNLPSFLFDWPVFATAPTLLALVFILIFIGYLSIVWMFAGKAQERLHGPDPEQGSYVLSNILFSVPVLLPWFILSGFSDLVFALPFDAPKKILSSTPGEIGYFLFFLALTALIGPAMIQRLWRCHPLEPGPFRARVEALCEKTQLRYADILSWPVFGGKMITAGVMGLTKRFRYILVTNALFRSLLPEEVDAVIAHEIGHVKKRHLAFYLLFFIGYLLVSYAAFDVIVYAAIYLEPSYRLLSRFGGNPATGASILFSVLMIATFLIYFRCLFGYFMRNFERQADGYVYSVLENAKTLISTFHKIGRTSGQPMDRPNWHHFSLKERIDFLEKCESDKQWIRYQDQKIQKSMAVYLAGILLVGYAMYHLNFGQTGKRLNTRLIERILVEEIRRSPQQQGYHAMLGDLYYADNRYQEAARVYEDGLALFPEDSRVLNNLAWLYATCPEKALLNPSRAVHLARRAAALEPSSHVWDTLAESLFISGDTEGAVDAGKKALAAARDNRGYYEDQIQKFAAGLKTAGGQKE